MIIPVQKQAKRLTTFLEQVWEELKISTLTEKNLKYGMEKPGFIRVNLLAVLADLQGLSKLDLIKGVNGKILCWFCTIECFQSPSSNTYFYPCEIHMGDGTKIKRTTKIVMI